MANNIKGITIEIGGNTGPLTSALKDVNKAAGDAQSGLKEVNKQLKFDPKNVVLSGQKVDLLKDKVAALADKQKILKQAVSDAQAQFEKGDLGKDKVQAVEREYEKVNSQLKDTKKELNEAEQATGTFSEKVKAKFSDIKDSIKSAFSKENIKTALGAIGATVSAFLINSTSKAAEAQGIDSNLEQTIKSTGDASGLTAQQMSDLAEKEQGLTTFSADSVKEGEAMLATFTGIGKDVFPQATQSVLDFAQKMGTDPKTAAMQLGKALNDPTTGLSKLTKSGVTFTDQQKKQIAAMQKTGNTAGAQKLMLQELNKEFGGQAAAAADTYSGKQKQVKNQLDEVQETIGGAVLPVLTKLLKSIAPIIEKISDFVSKSPKLTAAILVTIGILGTLIGGLSLVNTVAGLFNVQLTTTQMLLTGGIMLAIMALIAIVALIITHWTQVKTFFIGLWNTIKGLFSGVGAWFQSVFAAGASGVQSAWNGITGFFSGIWSGIQGAFSAVGNWFSGIFSAAAGGIQSAWSGITGFFSSAWSGITNVWSAATGFFSGIWSGISGAFSATKSWFGSTFGGAWDGIKNVWNGASGWFGGIWDDIKGHFKPDMISTGFSDAWGSIQGAWGGAGKWFGGVWDDIKGGFAKLNPFQWGKDLIDGIANGIKSAADHVKTAVGNVAQNIKSFLHFSVPDEGPLADYETWMPDFMAGLANGITGSMGPVMDAAQNVASGIAKNIQVSQTTVPKFQARVTSPIYDSAQDGAAINASMSNSQPVSLTLVTPSGRMLGKFVAPYVGKELEFNAKDMFSARG